MRNFKKILFISLFTTLSLFTQAQTALSSAMLKPMRGAVASFSSFTQKDSLMLICFWSVNADESINELNAINTHYDNWKESVKFKLMAVSIDDGKVANRVRPTALGNGWTFSIFIDINGDLRKALGSSNLPQSFVVKNGKVVYQQSGYESGTENYLFQKIIQFSNSK
ncbi:MAG TPA: redoxin domain-containing protein [Puia sp.]|nr:redoxin domain-containing protein [Puia sp.]